MDLSEGSRRPLERHPWEEARFRFFLRVLRRSLDLDATEAILDVGAGDAWFAEQLVLRTTQPRVVCWDTGYTSDVLGGDRLPRAERLQFVATRPTDRFPLVLLLDVLEHIEHDREFLSEIVRENVAPGGAVLISVPAWPFLFSSHDIRLRHFRRYTPTSARRAIESTGLRTVRSAGLFPSLGVIRLLQVACERAVGVRTSPDERNELQMSAWLAAPMRALLLGDQLASTVSAELRLPVPGLSWWALCRREPLE